MPIAQWIAFATAIAYSNIEVAIWSEDDFAAFMVGEGLVDFEQDECAVFVGQAQVHWIDVEPFDHCSGRVSCHVIHIE